MATLTFRYAEKKDSGTILSFIKALAEYEKMLDDVVATEELLSEWIFDKKKAEVIFACEDGKEVGFALFFHNFSTFLGRAGVYLEDLSDLSDKYSVWRHAKRNCHISMCAKVSVFAVYRHKILRLEQSVHNLEFFLARVSRNVNIF